VSRAERWGYTVAVIVLIVGGALLRSVILNWICGPAIVIGCVALSTWIADRRRRLPEGEPTP